MYLEKDYGIRIRSEAHVFFCNKHNAISLFHHYNRSKTNFYTWGF